MIWFTIFFALFLFACILLADMGMLEPLMRLMHSLPLGDKIVHFFVIGLLSFLVNRTALSFSRKNPQLMLVVTTFSLIVLFTLEELSQIPIPGRDASLLDLGANNAGILVFAWFAWQTGIKTDGGGIAKSIE
jgi:VanZ family protein